MIPSGPEAAIASAAERLFLDRGFGAVTTDEIAREAGVSKKTLYRLYPSKRDLLLAVVRASMGSVERRLGAIRREPGHSGFEKLLATFREAGAQIHRLGGFIVRDFYRTVPEVWDVIEEFRTRVVFTHVQELIGESRREGRIRRDVDERLMVLIVFSLMKTILVPEQLAGLPYTAGEVFDACLRTVFTGVLTAEGRLDFEAFAAKEVHS